MMDENFGVSENSNYRPILELTFVWKTKMRSHLISKFFATSFICRLINSIPTIFFVKYERKMRFCKSHFFFAQIKCESIFI